MCAELIRAGYDARYMLWREDAPELKACVNGNYDRYAELMDCLLYTSVPCAFDIAHVRREAQRVQC